MGGIVLQVYAKEYLDLLNPFSKKNTNKYFINAIFL